MKITRIVPFVLLLCVTLVYSAEVKSLPVEIKNSNPAIQYLGRVSDDYKSAWTGTGLKFKFNGTAAQAEIKGNKIAFQVVVDNKPTKVIYINKDQTLYDLAEGLAEGEHTIELFRRNEAYFGDVKYLGLRLSEGAKLEKVEPKKRKLMVIGDSITCGYANEAPNLNTGNTLENENGYMSYAPIAARALDADVMMISWSGRGMHRNRSAKNDKDNTMPKMFDRILPMQENSVWDHQKFVPDVIAINLGTNDREMYKGKPQEKPALKKEDYLATYREFIDKLHKLFPKAKIIASIGPMGQGPFDKWLPELTKDYDFVSVLVYNNPGGKKWLGGHWHPAVQLDEHMGKLLADKSKEVAGW